MRFETRLFLYGSKGDVSGRRRCCSLHITTTNNSICRPRSWISWLAFDRGGSDSRERWPGRHWHGRGWPGSGPTRQAFNLRRPIADAAAYVEQRPVWTGVYIPIDFAVFAVVKLRTLLEGDVASHFVGAEFVAADIRLGRPVAYLHVGVEDEAGRAHCHRSVHAITLAENEALAILDGDEARSIVSFAILIVVIDPWCVLSGRDSWGRRSRGTIRGRNRAGHSRLRRGAEDRILDHIYGPPHLSQKAL
mmetsp:Transcript_4619/g.10702  ORF Transcript_4619/g.10702 Transcript_4619/m.10702 type:complete len:248 (+) Transcript_4619:2570-3313(+)